MTRATKLLLFAAIVAGAEAREYARDESCSNPLSLGGEGDCSPICSAVARSTKPGCVITRAAVDYASILSGIASKTCTQSTDARCTAAALAARVGSFPSILAAYCNDEYLIVHSAGAPSGGPYLDDPKTPPGGNDDVNGECVTRMSSLGDEYLVSKFPLSPAKLSTAAWSNNIESYLGAGDGDKYYLTSSDGTTKYGLPSAGPIGLTVSGSSLFPLFNNRAEITVQDCEVDACHEHVGQGGGQPHIHGDPFHKTDNVCLYSPQNYTSQTAHPPFIAWSLDGYEIFGRYLYDGSLGASVTLDDCGGHEHDSLGYHYHAQVINAVTNSAAKSGISAGIGFATFTPGVYKCWRGDISKVPGGADEFWSSDKNSAYLRVCAGSTEYYVKSGYALSNLGSSTTSTDSSSEIGPAPCASGTDDSGKKCPPDETNGPCPPGCELSRSMGRMGDTDSPTTAPQQYQLSSAPVTVAAPVLSLLCCFSLALLRAM